MRSVVAGLGSLLVALSAGTGAGEEAGAGAVGGAPEHPIAFDRGQFLLSESETPPPATAAWEPVRLTDLWRETRPGVQGRGWYRFEFTLATVAEQRWAVYLPGLASNAAVWVNGERVGDGGRMREPVSLNSNRPLLFGVSPRSLRVGTNRVDVALFAHRDSWDRLEPLLVGPHAVLAPRFERQAFWGDAVPRFASGLMIALLLLVGAIWLGSHRAPVYGAFLATAGFWTIASANYHVRDPPLPFHDWERLVNGSLLAAAVFAVILARRLVELRRDRLETALLGGTLLAGLALALVPVGSLQDTARLLQIAAVAAIAYGVVVVARHRLLLQRAELPIFLLGGVGFFAVAAHDLSIQLGSLGMEQPRLLPLGGPLLMITFAGCLTARFARASDWAERLNVELEERVRVRERELAESYRRMATYERHVARSTERSRLLREVHDGMGSKIVSSLALLEAGGGHRERIAEILRGSLDDMRLLIRSLEPGAGDLDTFLGTLRERLEARLEGAVHLDWCPGDLPEGASLSPEQAHHLARILDEAFANVLKHANARVVRISTGLETTRAGACAVVCVRDDGRWRERGQGGGRGLENMRERAAALGGALAIVARPDGTEVRIEIPLPSAARD